MNVQVNTNKAVSAVKAFLQSHGGEAKHSEVLELVANICGFQNYRAMAAVTGETSRGTKKTVASSEQGRAIENEENVVFRATVEDWNKDEHPNSPVYDIIFENNGENFRVLMKPQGTHLDNFQGHPVLDVNFEVNDGVPCAHMTNDVADSMAVSVFGTGGGLLVRPDDGEWMTADSSGVPAVLGELAQEACLDKELHTAYAAVIDTKEKYSDDDHAVTTRKEQAIRQYVELSVTVALDDVDVSTSTLAHRERQFARLERLMDKGARAEGDRRVKVILSNQTHTASGAKLDEEKKAELPSTRAQVLHPIKRKDVGAVVEVSFDDTIDEAGEHLWLDVDLYDKDGQVEDDDHVGCLSSYEIGASVQELRHLTNSLSKLVAFFVSAGYSMRELQGLIIGIVEHPTEAPHTVSQLCVGIADSAPDKHTAYQQVLKLLHPAS